MPYHFDSIDPSGDVDSFSVSLRAGKTYYFDLESPDVGVLGELENGTLTLFRGAVELAFDDNGGVGRDARLVFTARQSGVYSIEVAGVGNSTGNYELYAFEDDFKNTVEGAGVAGTVRTGTTRSGIINYSADEAAASDQDAFKVSLIGGLTYTIDIRDAEDGRKWTLDSSEVALLDLDGDPLTFSFGEIEWASRYSGTHYVEVLPFLSDNTGSYGVFVSAGRASSNEDFVVGTAQPDSIRGLAGNDEILGGGGDDSLMGDSGSDLLKGVAGDDIIVGGLGRDRLVGGKGLDNFRFESNRDSTASGHDVIRGGGGAPAFQGVAGRSGDLIDVSGLDANTTVSGTRSTRLAERVKGTYL
jgi:Ca2+-binding RTX toxin-like protein